MSSAPILVSVSESGQSAYSQTIQAGRHQLTADEPESYGGKDLGPSPYDFLLAGLGACTSMTIRMYASRKQWPLEQVIVHLTHSKIHAQYCAECETETARVDRIERRIELHGNLTPEQREKLLEIADKCPVHRTLQSEISIKTCLVDASTSS